MFNFVSILYILSIFKLFKYGLIELNALLEPLILAPLSYGILIISIIEYNVKYINQVKEQDWSSLISKIKYVTWEENSGFKIPNVFHMWCSIVENVKFLEKINKEEGLNFDYVLRFRTDIICKDGLSFLSNEFKHLKDNEVLFPSNLHWKGLNDSFFISNFNTILKFKNFLTFQKENIENVH